MRGGGRNQRQNITRVHRSSFVSASVMTTATRTLLRLSTHRVPLQAARLPSRLLHVTPALSAPASSSTPPPPPTPKAKAKALDQHSPTWLTGVVQKSPLAMGAFLRVLRLLGYGSTKQIAVRRTAALYEVICAGRAEEEGEFWREREYSFRICWSFEPACRRTRRTTRRGYRGTRMTRSVRSVAYILDRTPSFVYTQTNTLLI
jgi:hypothetical protein